MKEMAIGTNQDPFLKAPHWTLESIIRAAGDLDIGLRFFEIAPAEHLEFTFNTMTTKKRVSVLEVAKSYNMDFTIHGPWCEPVSGISCVNDGIRREAVKQLKKCFQLAYDLEAPLVTVHGGSESCVSKHYSGQAWKNMIMSLKETLVIAADLGIDLCVENMPVSTNASSKSEPYLLTQPKEFHALFNEINHDRLKMTFDIGHANVGHGDIDSFIEQFGKIFRSIHINDNDFEHQHWSVGKGIIDYDVYLKKISMMGYDGPYVLEVSSIEDIVISCNTLRQIVSRL
jgi:sugar phosphate isomerase/epimerase